MPAIALSDNDVAFLAWKLERKIPGCLGFAIYRRDAAGTETPLPAWVGFEGQSNPDWKQATTAVWPVQKFTWRDLTAQREQAYTYRIVPMVGTPGALSAQQSLSLTTNSVTITERRGSFSAFFNRGILSTQYLARALGGDFTSLKGRIDTPGDLLRNQLSGQLREAMLGLFARARAEGGKLYCALYELTDPELLPQLLAGKGFAHIILSNTGPGDEENAPARKALHAAGIDVTDRMVPSGHIGHNKFVVYAGGDGKPQAVWTGSTNWTETGLCAQNNNGILVESGELAAAYMDYWNRLKADGSAQAAAFRRENQAPHPAALSDSSRVQAWFSPNTTQKSKPKDPVTPVDMAALFGAMDGAREAILFLAFQPGEPSIVDQAAAAQNKNPALFVRGAVTDPKAVEDFTTHLFHRSADPRDTDVVAAAAVNDQFSYWEKEMLKSSPMAHAIIHDKIVVIDPLSPDCVVVTGSHNLGFRASYNNDENLLIIRGNRELAAAYATHVMDVYDHYRWRFTLQQAGAKAWTGLSTSDTWQDKYFASGSVQARELSFWTGD